MEFQNQKQLTERRNRKMREAVLDIAKVGIDSVIPYDAVKKLVSCDGKQICIGDLSLDLEKIRSIYVVGAGKGSFPIAQALDEILKGRIKKGTVAVKKGEKRRLQQIEILESSHPIPDGSSIEAAARIKEILDEAEEGDLVFAAVTGGSSAMVNMPAEGITLEDLTDMNTQLLRCGAEIGKINTVRKHICLMKGGRMVQYGQPATVITLTFDTAPPDMPWPDMCLSDPTTFADAIHMLRTYELWETAPQSIRTYLEKGLSHPELETVKSLDGMKQRLFSVADPRLACMSAAQRARELGYEPCILSTTLEGEAKDTGIFLAGLTDEILSFDRPFKVPCALISGGETTVTIHGACEEGGPNQETVLGFINKIRHDDGYVCLSMDTDGTDGPCDIAGGIADGETRRRIAAEGINLNEVLLRHGSSAILKQLGEAVYTGHTGTNVMNLRIVLIGGKRDE